VSGAAPPRGAPANPVWLVRLGNFLFKMRNALFPIVLVLLVALTRPGAHLDSGLDNALDALGFMVACAGQALRIAVIGYRYIIRGGRDRKVYADGLVTAGCFALSRNPLYLGNLLILTGVFLIWNNPWVYIVGLPVFLLAYRAIVAAEEDYLGRQFGAAYAAYVRATPRWWPRLSGFREATAGIPFNWRRVVIKEYTTTALWLGGAILLLMIEARGPVWPHWLAIGLLAVAWGWARYLKKSRRLAE
jgi:protein-S-isoprenylcysteine O-methyltransferase Ste14